MITFIPGIVAFAVCCNCSHVVIAQLVFVFCCVVCLMAELLMNRKCVDTDKFVKDEAYLVIDCLALGLQGVCGILWLAHTLVMSNTI